MTAHTPGEDASIPPSRRRRTGVLVHGCNLHTYQWKKIVWGKPPDELGRVPKGVFVALYEDADVIVFGTGASEKDGVLEADATVRLMWKRFDALKDFSLFQTFLPDMQHSGRRETYREKLRSILEIENTSQNTVEEVVRAGYIFNEHRIDRVILVSSPTHLPRCLRDACIAFDTHPDLARFKDWVSATPSITNYMGRTAADVAIFEPPHRPDRPPFNINDFLKRVNDIPGGQRQAFLKRFDELLQEFDV